MHFSLLQPRDQTFRLTESLFLRLLGLVYLIAFASFWPQIIGLIGAHGIAPATPTLTAMHADYGWRAYLYVPSLFWFSQTDAALKAICVLGCAAAVLLILGRFSRSAALAAYTLYLSIVTIGQPFTSFQWDALLLESGFLAIFAGANWLPLAYRLLVFRLMFESGLVKLTSGDVNWRSLHALRFHFLTQPLPSPLAYYMYQAPAWLLDFLTLATLFIELAVPFLVFAHPGRLRLLAASSLVLLQVAIALTCNFAFFNLLSIFLCFWALDDSFFPRRQVFRPLPQPAFPKVFNAAVVSIILLSVIQIFGLEPSFLESFEIVNPYGLFAVMTTSRVELVIEGCNDNIHWEPYSFLYKPGDIHRSLPIVAPYQPRLDWQMWFAALGTPESNVWTKTLVYRLLTAEPSVVGLLGPSPFSQPPRSIRILAYTYTFTDPPTRTREATIWNRKLIGTWFHPVSIDSLP